MAKTKSISFNKHYEDEYNFLMSQPSPSTFVCELIRKYMQQDDNFEDRVKDILIKYLSSNAQPMQPFCTAPIENKLEEIEDPWG